MNLLYKLGFTARFNTIKIGILIDKFKTSLSIQAVINNLLEEGVEFLILDINKEYMIRERYFDLIIADRNIFEKYNSFYLFNFLLLDGCLLLQTIDNNKYFTILPIKFQGFVTVLYNTVQITYNGILYKNE